MYRQSTLYAVYFAGIGASMPFMPLWFAAQGFTGGQIGLILAGPYVARAAVGPLIGAWSQRFTTLRTPIVWLGIGSALVLAVMTTADVSSSSFWLILLAWCIGFSALTCINPLIDTMTFQLSQSRNFSFGHPRAAGSAAFVVATLTLGLVLTTASPEIVPLFIIGAAVGCSLVSWRVVEPVAQVRADGGPQRGPKLMSLLMNWNFMRLLICLGLLQASHSFYYSFSTLIWQSHAISSAVTGALWATGILAEIAYLFFSKGLRTRLSPWRVLQIAGALGVLRWLVMTIDSLPVWVLFLVQLLHGFTFAAVFMAGLELIQSRAGPGGPAQGQVLYSALGPGLMMGLGTLLSGALHDRFGAGGYGGMAVMSLAGLGIALTLKQRLSLAALPATSSRRATDNGDT